MANNNFDDTIWQGVKKPCQVSKTAIKKHIKKQAIITTQLINYL